MRTLKTLKHPETRQAIWLEAEPVWDLLNRLKEALETAPGSELGPEPERDAALEDARHLLHEREGYHPNR